MPISSIAIRDLGTSLRPVLATVAARGDGFISEAKHLRGVELINGAESIS